MNRFDIQNDIQKRRYYVLVVLILTAILFANCFLLTPITSAATIVHCDPSDGYIRDGIVDQLSLLKAVDGESNLVHRIFVKFPIPHGTASSSARLYIFADSNRKDHGAVDETSPLQNPGFGDSIVYYINDYDTLDAGDFNAQSIGNFWAY